MLDRVAVVRAVQQAVLEAVLLGRAGVVQGAFLQPRHRIHYHRRGQFAARQHVVADRDLLIHLGLDQALVHALVAPAQQRQPRQRRQFAHPGLVQRPPLRAQVDQVRTLQRLGRAHRRQAAAQRLHQHDHARPAAEAAVIDLAVIALGVVARIPAMQLQQPALAGAAGDAEAGALVDELRKQADDVDAHRVSRRQHRHGMDRGAAGRGPARLRIPDPSRP